MTELVTIKKVNFKPAQIETNVEEVSKSLDLVLAKYENLVFIEDNVGDCKKTITELNKGKKQLDDFRKSIKKELTTEVTIFENEIKELSKKFDNVLDPIKLQYDKFEEDRRNEKRERVLIFVSELIREYELNDKYKEEVIIEDKYLNKTTTDKSIKEDLETQIKNLKNIQEKEESDIEVIKMKVELANAKNNTNLVPETYISLLNYEDIESISEKITKDAEKTVEVKEEIKIIPKYESTNESDEKFVEKYKVTGTEKQLDDLEEYMSSRGLSWQVIE